MQRHCYLTRRPYNQHPIGSKCFAFRVDCGRKIALEFLNGDVIELPGGDNRGNGIVDGAWPEEIEEDLVPMWEEGMRKSLEEPVNEMIMEFKRRA